MSDHIKSADLCERCVYGYARWCQTQDCRSCEMAGWENDDECHCKCGAVKLNTPCPYFEEAQEESEDKP